MVRTEPLTEVLSNMKLSFGASPGPVVRPTEVKNDFLLAYRGVGIGDDVAIDKGKREKTGRVTQMLRKGIVCVSIEGGGSKSVDAQRVHIKTPAEPLDLTNVMQEPPEYVGGPPADALAVLPDKDDAVKVCDGAERFWTLVTSVEGDVVHGIVINRLVGGHPFAEPGTRIKFLKKHIYMIEGYVPGGEAPKKLYLGQHQRAVDHFRSLIKEKVGEEKYAEWIANMPNGYAPAAKADVEAWFREEAKKDPSLLDGSGGLVADDIGV